MLLCNAGSFWVSLLVFKEVGAVWRNADGILPRVVGFYLLSGLQSNEDSAHLRISCLRQIGALKTITVILPSL